MYTLRRTIWSPNKSGTRHCQLPIIPWLLLQVKAVVPTTHPQALLEGLAEVMGAWEDVPQVKWQPEPLMGPSLNPTNSVSCCFSKTDCNKQNTGVFLYAPARHSWSTFGNSRELCRCILCAFMTLFSTLVPDQWGLEEYRKWLTWEPVVIECTLWFHAAFTAQKRNF